MNTRGSNYILAKFDVSGIQDYIFASNRLRENAGASCQVTRILGEFLTEAFKEAADLRQAEIRLDWQEAKALRLPEDERIMAEILYIGGGNAVALFRDPELFRRTGEKLAVKAAENCQGIYLATAHIQTNLKDFAADKEALDSEMDKVKRTMVRRPVYSPFPVVEQDNLSRQPITCRVARGEAAENLTGMQFQKREAYKQIHEYQKLFPKLEGGINYSYPEEMEQLCRERGEDSIIAIVHIDGNGMGERIQGLMQQRKGYSDGTQQIRCESKRIAELFRETYAATLQKLCDCLFPDPAQEEIRFPLRPIILDGDDFTFLCRAELAVPFAAGFMRELMQGSREAMCITACCGIAFVHSHFPFRVAYSIAEESCSRAKEMWYAHKQSYQKERVSCLDFRVIKESEVGQPVKIDAQKRPYSVRLSKQNTDENSLKRLYHTLIKMENWPSGRLRKIYRALLEGEGAQEPLKREFTSRGYKISRLDQGKWTNSPLFDALELQGLCHTDLLGFFQRDSEERADG